MNAENDRYHIPPQKAAEGAGQKDETRLRVVFFIILPGVPGDYFTIRKCRGCFDRTAEKAAWFSKENQAAIPYHTVFSW